MNLENIPAEKSPNQKSEPDCKKLHYNSSELFKGAREVEIHHQNVLYRLIITKTGKLVLNK